MKLIKTFLDIILFLCYNYYIIRDEGEKKMKKKNEILFEMIKELYKVDGSFEEFALLEDFDNETEEQIEMLEDDIIFDYTETFADDEIILNYLRAKTEEI